jgi:hypothetical protein
VSKKKEALMNVVDGEKIMDQFAPVKFYHSTVNRKYLGTLAVTNYQLAFIPSEPVPGLNVYTSIHWETC